MHHHAEPSASRPASRSAAERTRSSPPAQRAARVHVPAPNRTGLPDSLKAGVESLSGQSLDHVRVHRNSPMPAQLNAHAYAQGSDIHLAPGQEKHLPHEAWHVVQQAQGRVRPTMQLKDGGVPINDDRGLEHEADVMGARAAQRKVAPPPAGKNRAPAAPGRRVVQRNVTVNGESRYFTRTAWPNVSGLATITNLTAAQQLQARAILDRWIHASAGSSTSRTTVSENRSYGNWQELADALAGEVLSAANLATENALTATVHTSANIAPRVLAFMQRLQLWHQAQAANMQAAAINARGRYRIYYGASGFAFTFGYGTTLHDGLIANLPGTIYGRVTLAADYALFARAYIAPWVLRLTAAHTAARSTHWNPNEGAQWTQTARINNVPLSAGPSATTAQILTLGQTIGATANEMEAMAWGIFAFFNNGLDLNLSGTHRFHEVMNVAVRYGVPYAGWAYPAAAP